MNKSLLLGAAALVLAAAVPARAVPADFAAKADALLTSAYPDAGPGAAVIVTDDGKVVYARGRGLADIEAKVPITPDTVFRMGSITKQFSAAVMLQLVAEGKVSLDDRLSKYLPDYPQPGADATIEQLLNHTVGIQSYTGIPGWMVEANTSREYSTEQMIALFRDLPSPFKPGEQWDYNNSGYVLVGAVIEKVTGTAWHQAVEERIARPLGLTTVRYGTMEATMPRMAKGYTAGEKGVAPAQSIHMSVPHAAGALIGSLGDLAKWNHALHHGKVIPAELYARMIAPTKLPGGKVEDYGFGIGPRTVRGRPAIGHGGGIFGFSTDSIYLPKEGLFVAVFANSDRPAATPGVVMHRLAALAIGDPYPLFSKAEVKTAAVKPLFGSYRLAEGERHFFARDGKLYTRRSGGGDLEVFAAGKDRFFYGPDNLTWFEVRRDATGKHAMAMYRDGAREAELATRTGPVPPEPKAADVPQAILRSYAGKYTSMIAPIMVAVNEAGQLALKFGDQQFLPLRATSATEFSGVGVDARVVFQVAAGKVTGLAIHQGGRELPAARVAD